LKNYKYFLTFFILHCLLTLGFCEEQVKVLVSIAPHRFLLQRIAGDKISVDIFVPSNANPHTYEPSPRQMISAIEAKIWFRNGEEFEKRLLGAFENRLCIVDLRKNIPLIPFSCHCHHPDSYDSHIWLSPLLLKEQARTMTEALCRLMPHFEDFFINKLDAVLHELDQLDDLVHLTLKKNSCPYILVSHPAFGYFCKEYGLNQLSIEIEGKEPSAKQITHLVKTAKDLGIHYIFIEPQHSQKGAKRIAQELDASLVLIDPYQENVFDCIANLGRLFSQ
jgi:zinc transport system substrate-binding protein